MARRLGDIEYTQGFRFEWSERRRTGELCGWFFPDTREDGPDESHRMWIIATSPYDGEASYFVQTGPGRPDGNVVASLEMAIGYLIGWFTGRNEW
jgi:hypothetical protein